MSNTSRSLDGPRREAAVMEGARAEEHERRAAELKARRDELFLADHEGNADEIRKLDAERLEEVQSAARERQAELRNLSVNVPSREPVTIAHGVAEAESDKHKGHAFQHGEHSSAHAYHHHGKPHPGASKSGHSNASLG
eukprot:tig00000792_g4188.t1